MAEAKLGRGNWTNKKVHQWLEDIRTECWISLHFDTPASSNYNTEFTIVPGGYSRARAWFTEPSNRTMWNTNNIRWGGMSPNQILYIGGWDAETNGDLMFWEKVPGNGVRVGNGQGWQINAQQLVISFA